MNTAPRIKHFHSSRCAKVKKYEQGKIGLQLFDMWSVRSALKTDLRIPQLHFNRFTLLWILNEHSPYQGRWNLGGAWAIRAIFCQINHPYSNHGNIFGPSITVCSSNFSDLPLALLILIFDALIPEPINQFNFRKWKTNNWLRN